jgi:hypothetical protein
VSRILAVITGMLWAALVPDCSGPPKVVSVLTVSATIDGEEPLAGVRVSASGRPLGETDASGRIVTEIRGGEGQDIPLFAACPAGYRGPPGPIALRLSRVRSLGNSSGALMVTVPCRPSKRRVAVVVSAPGLPDAPLLVDGTPSARTDRDGVAHVLVLVAPGDVITVALGASVTRSFRASDTDEILVLAAETIEPPSAPRTRWIERRHRIQLIQ